MHRQKYNAGAVAALPRFGLSRHCAIASEGVRLYRLADSLQQGLQMLAPSFNAIIPYQSRMRTCHRSESNSGGHRKRVAVGVTNLSTGPNNFSGFGKLKLQTDHRCSWQLRAQRTRTL